MRAPMASAPSQGRAPTSSPSTKSRASTLASSARTRTGMGAGASTASMVHVSPYVITQSDSKGATPSATRRTE
ncbi:MAG: hypothetical protein M5U28_45470 [Sandaracinaceae bacterium]|nr:hypothetical protein [Sandaracinaceae bacterium]